MTSLLKEAKREVVVVAPFIKANAITRLIECVDVEHVKFDCVTRWIPEDIAAGVCDIDIFDLIDCIPHGRLWVNERLHAKYVRVDQRCIVGSANITESALGWRTPANLELMIDVSFEFQNLQNWEQSLFDSSNIVDDAYRDLVWERSSALGKDRNHEQNFDFLIGSKIDKRWIPSYSEPSKLYRIYDGDLTNENMPESAHKFAIHDLNVLGIPSRMLERDFNSVVAKQLHELEIFHEVLDASSRGKDAGVDMTGVMEITMCHINDAAECRNVARRLIDWIRHFLGDEYKAEAEVVRLIKARSTSGM